MDEDGLVIGGVYYIPVHSNVVKSIPSVCVGKKKYYSNSPIRYIVAFRSLITGEPEISTFTKFSMRSSLLIMNYARHLDLSNSEKGYLEERLKSEGIWER